MEGLQMHACGDSAHLGLIVIQGDDTLHNGAAIAAAFLALTLAV